MNIPTQAKTGLEWSNRPHVPPLPPILPLDRADHIQESDAEEELGAGVQRPVNWQVLCRIFNEKRYHFVIDL